MIYSKFNKNTMYGEWIDVELRRNRLWVIVSNLLFVRPSGQHVHLTPYLITDYATIPKPFLKIFPKRHDTYDLATAFHDDCWNNAWYNSKNYDINLFNCHSLFNEIMLYFNVFPPRRIAMYRSTQIADPFIRIGRTITRKKCGDIKYSCAKLTSDEKVLFDKIVETFPQKLRFYRKFDYNNLERQTIDMKTFLSMSKK